MQLTDEQWGNLAPLLVGKQGDPGASGRNNRLFIEAVFWIASSAALWRTLPAEFGKWNTTYMRFKRWNECDVWRELAENLQDDPELHPVLEKVVIYGDLQTRRMQQRMARQANKQVYNASMAKCQNAAHQPSGMEASTLHWVGLVMGETEFS